MAIFFHSDEQKNLAETSKRQIDSGGSLPGPIVTEIIPASNFYSTEEYHQDYYKKIHFATNSTGGLAVAITGWQSFGQKIDITIIGCAISS